MSILEVFGLLIGTCVILLIGFYLIYWLFNPARKPMIIKTERAEKIARFLAILFLGGFCIGTLVLVCLQSKWYKEEWNQSLNQMQEACHLQWEDHKLDANQGILIIKDSDIMTMKIPVAGTVEIRRNGRPYYLNVEKCRLQSNEKISGLIKKISGL